MVEWDMFLRKRERAKTGKRGGDDMRFGTGLVGISQMGLDGKGGTEDWKAFTRLVRGGIPLAYRSDVWAGESLSTAE